MSVRKNLVANFAGSVWTGLMSLLFIPIYVRLMGIEAYGLVGFYVTLQSMFAILDLGLSTTTNRELARLSATDGQEQTQRDLLRTVEAIYWIVAFLNGAIVLLAAGAIARLWVKPEHLSVGVIQTAVSMMGLVLLFQWPLGMYSGGLQGLQKQVQLNVINSVMAGLRGIGAVLVLWLVSPTVVAFFVWQAIVSALHTGLIAWSVWRSVGGARGARFDLSLLETIWKFAAGMIGISLLATVLIQIDKLVVSKVLPLASFGYYTIAATVAASLYRVISPVFTAFFPRFSQLVAMNDERQLASLYHRGCAMLSVIVLPAAAFIAVFAREALLLWTQDPVTASSTHRILSVLIIGTAMNGILNLPYAIQLAYGWTKLTLVYNLVAVVLLVPGVWFLATRWGAVGASLGWLAYNTTAVLIIPALMHRRVLRGETARFYLRDVGLPFAVAAIAAIVCRLFIDVRLPLVMLATSLAAAAAVVQLAAMATLPDVRTRAVALLRRKTS